MTDEYYMTLALGEARQALLEGEVPIGAIVTAGGRIVGRGHNQTERLGDVTAHAEMLAISAAAQALGGKFLGQCTLYVTVEPCLMCAGAIAWSRVGRLVVGTGDPKRGYKQYVGREPFHPKTDVTFGICQQECRSLMQDFFKGKRPGQGIMNNGEREEINEQ